MSRFRQMEMSEMGRVAELVREAFMEPARRFSVSSDTCPVHPANYTTDTLRRDIAGGRRFYLLENGSEIQGCISLRDSVPGVVEAARLAVHRGLQGRGIGSTLLEHAAREAQRAGASRLQVFLFAQYTDLAEWYGRRGFHLLDTCELNDVPGPVSTMVRTLSGEQPAFVRLLGTSDIRTLETFLLKHLASSAMLLSNVRKGGLVDQGRERQATYCAAFRDSQIIGVAALCWNGQLLVQAPEMLEPIVRTLVAVRRRPIEGVVGPELQVARVARVLDLPTGKAPGVLIDSHEYLYSLDLNSMPLPEPLHHSSFKVRRVEPRDVPVLTDWMVEFNLEAMNRHLSRAEVEANLLRRDEERDNRWVLESEQGLLATSGFNAATAEVVQVGGVYTPPELRGRKFARSVVAGSLLEAKASGVPLCVLFTAWDNVPAQRAYDALNFQRVGEYRLLLFRQPMDTRLLVTAF